MGRKRKNRGNQIRGADRRSAAWLLTDAAYDALCVSGYVSASDKM